MPGAAPSAMAAMAIPPSDEADDGSYADDPDAVVRVGNATRVPRNRIRRALRERDFNTVAARGVDPAVAAPAAAIGGAPADAATVAAVTDAFAPAAGTPATFASLGPALGPTATPVFSASLPPPANGGGTGGGTGGGNTGGDPGGQPGTDPVSAIPEPATWLSLILGFFGIGAALRRRNGRRALQPVTARALR
ncbi:MULTISPECIES: PEPxxWA-CTERM sorting domain-containing protein [unclassified Sphingopyxis]|jgi:hypothetical protein|uniref:PEPxxWA-CTERM sorting domain-containing protein n=1 Tax=unclassified Sphingopyxis TaxID=2614943 RepID=UPI0025F15389|nr:MULTISPECIES: PEPxxWA-CTERM sorting domain-containing protein [unclassified Sphingopyxis]